MTWNRRCFNYNVTSLIMLSFLIFYMIGAIGCSGVTSTGSSSTPSANEDMIAPKVVPYSDRWGIYALDIATEEVELFYSSMNKIAFLNLNKSGDTLAFSQQFEGGNNESEEICTLKVTDGDFTRVTNM